ncbi:MAG: hypothetical protein ACR2GY_06230 [Phycisphaerales bacterium]
MGERVLIADLNNFAMYPTVPVGYLAALCRNAGFEVGVFSPLSIGVQGIGREKRSGPLSLMTAKLNFRAAQSGSKSVRSMRQWIGTHLRSPLSRKHRSVLSAFQQQVVDWQPDIVLISSYLMYRELTEEICVSCSEHGIPAIVGGPYFAQPEVIQAWINIRGMTALAGGEIELQIPDIIRAVLDGSDLAAFEGVLQPDEEHGYRGTIARPLRTLDDVPYPDYSDFPWQRYPNRIVPMITGRGCGWGGVHVLQRCDEYGRANVSIAIDRECAGRDSASL